MNVNVPTLLLAAATALALASASAATIGVRQRLKRGIWWWVAANAGLVLALALDALAGRTSPAADVAVVVLALQWPVVTLAGIRRFFARGSGGVPSWVDGVVFALAALFAAFSVFAPFEAASAAEVFAVAMLAVTVHAAVAVVRLEDFSSTAVLKSLLIGLVCSAVLQAAWLGFAVAGQENVVPALASLAALLAPAATALLMPQLSLVLNHERNVSHLRASHRKLRHLVDVDALTRLPNRRHFQDLAEKAVKAAPELATVMVFDIDRLKHINDVLGHAVGDEALRQVGTVLRETLRRRDVAGRLGGDEFAVVLPRTKVEDAEPVIVRVRACIDDRQVAPRIARVVLNVGAVQMQAGETLADALRRAEIALELARDASRLRAQAEATMPLAPPAGAVAGDLDLALDPASTRSAGLDAPRASAAMPLMNLIPVGEVLAEPS